ncbi:MAG: hypothetical protein R2795_17385 [Saprospiraceae bacterium]
MKSFTLFVAALALFTSAAWVAVENVAVDTTASVITWKGYKVTGEHTASIKLKSGNLTMTDGALSGGSFDIDMSTINCTDLSGEWKGKLKAT